MPLRNTFFLTLAAAYLESMALDAIEDEGAPTDDIDARIYIAPNAIDYSGYPDCRPEFYEKVRETLMYGSKLWTQYGVAMEIETPIIHLSKAGIVRMGMDLKAPLDRTWTCYLDGPEPCGRCDSCVLRARGFAQAGRRDPLLAGPGEASVLSLKFVVASGPSPGYSTHPPTPRSARARNPLPPVDRHLPACRRQGRRRLVSCL